VCAPGFLCVETTSGDFCFAKCSPYLRDCPTGEQCAWYFDEVDIVTEGGEPVGFCFQDQGGAAPGGLCEDAGDCRIDALCLDDLEGTNDSFCRLGCDPTATTSPCPGGEECFTVTTTAGTDFGLCVPSTKLLDPCTSDADCGEGLTCGVLEDLTTACLRARGTGGANALCHLPNDCRSGICLNDGDGEPGYCFAVCADDAACGEGGICGDYTVDATTSIPGCFPYCEVDEDCASFGADWVCGLGVRDLNASGSQIDIFGSCTPPAGTLQDGDPTCTASDQCVSGYCMIGTGEPAGICFGLCGDDVGCAANSTCRAVWFDTGTTDGDVVDLCWYPLCERDADCPVDGACYGLELDPAAPHSANQLDSRPAVGPVGVG
jgi:hypothetical protein